MKDTVLFIDPICPRPYDPSTLDGKGIGGTEQTVVALAEGLADYYNVVVEQHNRSEEFHAKAHYLPEGRTQEPRWVILLRDSGRLPDCGARFPDAGLYLYAHDLAGRGLGLSYARGDFKGETCRGIVCVSQWHKQQVLEVLKAFGFEGGFRVHSIYNPLSADVTVHKGQYDKNKLLWLASPHKGLDTAYQLLKSLVYSNSEFKLYVTNPGYLEDYPPDDDIKENVVVLGTISHSRVIEELKSSLCLFYPNEVFPETFGKIMAEANGCGTPVLTCPIGAAREVLDQHPEQFIDVKIAEQVVKRVLKWHRGERPIVRGNPKFKLANVIREWRELLK